MKEQRSKNDRFQQAVALHQAGQVAQAAEIYRQLLKPLPKHADLLFMLGTAEYQLGNKSEAVKLLDRAIAINPANPMAFSNRGNALQELGRLQDALKSYDQAIRLKPDYVEAVCNKGNTLRLLGQVPEAIACYVRGLETNPNFQPAHYELGFTLQSLGRLDEAVDCYRRAIELRPDLAQTYAVRAAAYQDLRRFEEAIADYEMVIQMIPGAAMIYNNLGNVLKEVGRHDEACFRLKQSIELQPDHADTHNNLGVVLQQMRRLSEALSSFEQARRLNPNLVDAQWNLALARLVMGDYERGWQDYEARLHPSKLSGVNLRTYQAPKWSGIESLAGKTIFVVAEQGLGDTIQFCRYLPLLAQLGATVILESQPQLVGLMKSLKGVDKVLPAFLATEQIPDHDYYCPLMSLPVAFRTTLTTIPAVSPYLRADPAKSARWAERMGQRSRPRVGIVWSGGFHPAQPEVWVINKRRNMPLAKFAPLKNIDAEFYSLQKGQPAESELAELLSQIWDGPQLIDCASDLHDFTDTAALIENLDLVISVDTAAAHLAGALGKPTLLLSRFDSCWRWLDQRDDTPWYPSMTLLRQNSFDDWDEVVSRLIDRMHDHFKR